MGWPMKDCSDEGKWHGAENLGNIDCSNFKWFFFFFVFEWELLMVLKIGCFKSVIEKVLV